MRMKYQGYAMGILARQSNTFQDFVRTFGPCGGYSAQADGFMVIVVSSLSRRWWRLQQVNGQCQVSRPFLVPNGEEPQEFARRKSGTLWVPKASA